jgi:hypothetical protein
MHSHRSLQIYLLLGVPALAVCIFATSTVAAPTRDVPVQILSATTKDKVVAGAQVILQKEGQASVSGVTGGDGKVVLKSTFEADDQSVSLLVKKEGFSPLVVRCPCAGLSYAVSETLGRTLEAFRVVLNWGETPWDLDLHAVYPGNHIFFNAKKGTDAFLDVDDTDSYGPETVTVHKRHDGKNYVFAIHNFSASGQQGTSSLSTSGAKVFIYVGESLIKSYYVPTRKVGALWVVFAIDEMGAIHDINNVVDIAVCDEVPRYLRQITERTAYGTPMRAPSGNLRSAQGYLERGKTALTMNRLAEAIEAFTNASELDPNLAEAFTLLAEANKKLGRTPEASWFAKKAAKVAETGRSGNFRIDNSSIEITASSTLAPWKHYVFSVDGLLDDNLWSSWQPQRKRKGGVGEWVKLAFTSPQTVTGFEIYNGFRLIDELGDLYAMNNRIKEAELQFSDGTKMPITFEDKPVQATIALPTPKTGIRWITLTVKSIYKGSKWNDLAISELHVMGHD